MDLVDLMICIQKIPTLEKFTKKFLEGGQKIIVAKMMVIELIREDGRLKKVTRQRTKRNNCRCAS
jgi:hypothetical protein